MKHILLFLSFISMCCTGAFAQGAKNIKINEVLTNNSESLLDEYGEKLPWLELANTSFSTYDVRGMYIATDKAVLNKELSAPDRIKMMSQVPNGTEMTTLSAQEHVLFYLNSAPSKGYAHLDAKVDGTAPSWIALYDGNGVDLIDSVSIPVLAENQSFARVKNKDKQIVWEVKQPEFVSPGSANLSGPSESKIAKLKKDDPHGIGITILSMGVVFTCLALLFLAIRIFGFVMRRSTVVKQVVDMNPGNMKLDVSKATTKGAEAEDEEPSGDAKEEAEEKTPEITPEIAAVIAQAIQDYQDDVHVEESGIITLQPKQSAWGRR